MIMIHRHHIRAEKGRMKDSARDKYAGQNDQCNDRKNMTD